MAKPHILILGAGINGAAIARELLLQGARVTVVDTADIASGATAYSSRLIHGGLRYLEHGEFDLVRESLEERNRLLRQAPHLVTPLRLFIPVQNRWGGVWSSAAKFFGFKTKKPAARGYYLVRMGLWLYDWYAGRQALPPRDSHRRGEAGTPPVDAERYRWMCSYSDAQVHFAERFTIALLQDAAALATQYGGEFALYNYHSATFDGDEVVIEPVDANAAGVVPEEHSRRKFDAIINATGAWVDLTLQQMPVKPGPLMGPSKGSHLLTRHPKLLEAIGSDGIYAEAADGRPVFLLSFGDAVLIGTTDIPFDEDPGAAVASDEEIAYLCDATNQLFPQVGLTRSDIELHYCGVRPLPKAGSAASPGAVTRRHVLQKHEDAPVPVWSVIGGKLTTCRSLAEEAVAEIWPAVGGSVERNSRDRPLPGAEDYPVGLQALFAAQEQIAGDCGVHLDQVVLTWPLCGTQTASLLKNLNEADKVNISGTELPRGFVRRIIQNEWVHTLGDLVERRLMLLFDKSLTRQTLEELAQLLVEEEKLAASETQHAVEACVARLANHFGRKI